MFTVDICGYIFSKHQCLRNVVGQQFLPSVAEIFVLLCRRGTGAFKSKAGLQVEVPVINSKYGLRETDKRLNRLKKMEEGNRSSDSHSVGTNVNSQETSKTHQCKSPFIFYQRSVQSSGTLTENNQFNEKVSNIAPCLQVRQRPNVVNQYLMKKVTKLLSSQTDNYLYFEENCSWGKKPLVNCDFISPC